jgi:D-alanyl-D-alanine carboxypeptidase
VLIDVETGAVLYEKNAHEQRSPASLTKMATALTSLERGEPDQMIAATASSMVEPSVIGLDPGDRLPLREMLYGLLMVSGNDAALAIAESLGNGSIQRYVDWMNVMVRAMGLSDTHFANPHGLEIGDHYSSAYDMAIIGRVLMRRPLLRTIVATEKHDFDQPPLWAFRNINRLLPVYPGADGIKTGYETRAGRCLAASATRDGRQLIAVLLDDDNYIADATTLLDYGFAQIRTSPGAAPAASDSAFERLRANAPASA